MGLTAVARESIPGIAWICWISLSGILVQKTGYGIRVDVGVSLQANVALGYDKRLEQRLVHWSPVKLDDWPIKFVIIAHVCEWGGRSINRVSNIPPPRETATITSRFARMALQGKTNGIRMVSRKPRYLRTWISTPCFTGNSLCINHPLVRNVDVQ